MSAKHMRPFYVFAAVAAICSMVLVTGLRGDAGERRAPAAGDAPIVGGETIERFQPSSGLEIAGRPHRARGAGVTSEASLVTPTEALFGLLDRRSAGDYVGPEDFADLLPGFDGDLGDEGDPDAGDVVDVRPHGDPTGEPQTPDPSDDPADDPTTPEEPVTTTPPADPPATTDEPGDDFSDLDTQGQNTTEGSEEPSTGN